MNFIKPKSEIKLIVPVDAETAKQMNADLQKLLANISPEQLNLLARAVGSPIIKAAALAKLKEHFN